MEDLTDLDLESTLTGEDSGEAESLLDTHTDTGGVAGYSSGVIQSCSNTGTVGYPHVGYNIGGIVGRQTGYLAGCVNSGSVLGRKDVGGIVGQAEPDLTVTPGSDTLERLRTELDTLDGLIQRAIDDAQGTTDMVSAHLTAIGDETDKARDHTQTLADLSADFIDDGMDSLNSLSASVTNAPVSYTHLDVYKRQVLPWMRIARRSRCSGPVSRTMHSTTSVAEMHWEMTVAMATPATSSFMTITKKRFKMMFTTPARERKYSGRRVSPWARSSAAPKL